MLPVPTPNFNPTPLERCDDLHDADGDGVATDGTATDGILIFDLTDREAEIIDGEDNVVASYHNTLEGAQTNTDLIVDPTTYLADMANANADGVIIVYVRITKTVPTDPAPGGPFCHQVVELPILVNPLPVLTLDSSIDDDMDGIPDQVYEYTFCEDDADDVGQFIWTDVAAAMVPELLNTTEPLPLTDFTVTFHLSQADAQLGIAALVDGYENTADPFEFVYIRVENTATGCYNSNNIGVLRLIVEPKPLANTPNPYQECATNEADQDTAVFDLTSLDVQIAVDPLTDVSVSYYESMADADSDTPITTATAYTNTSNPQTLYARVRNNATGCLSDPAVMVVLQVNPLPVFTLPEDDILCVDPQSGVALDPREIGVDMGTDFSYAWNTPQGTSTNPIVTVTAAGTYSLTITDNTLGTTTACTYFDEVVYTPSAAPAALEVNVLTAAFSDTHSVSAIATPSEFGDADFEYQLDDGPWQTTGEFNDLEPGEHTITVRDVNGCGVIIKAFGLIDYMAFFTPNGDEYNPTWNIIGLQTQPAAKIYIFDRYGKLLKQISPAGPGWDGTYNGNLMPSSDYWFKVEYVDPLDDTTKEFINHFTLKR